MIAMYEREAKKQIVSFCKHIHSRGWIAACDGNVSVKTGRREVIITPSGVNKGFITEDDLITVDLNGKKLRGRKNPSSEILLHLEAYRKRPDVEAVIHAHPPKCIAFSIAGVDIPENVLPEVILTVGRIPQTMYATPTTAETAESITNIVSAYDAIILDHHGTLTVGKDLMEAYNWLERIEHAAEIIMNAHILGGIRPLTEEQIHRIQNLKKGEK